MAMISVRAVLAAFVMLVTLALGAGRSSAVEMRLVDGGDPQRSVVEISGRIEMGDAQRVAAFIENVPRMRPIAVHLNSPGGSLRDGMAMGRYFHAHDIGTFVVGRWASCVSACALAFLGGRERGGSALRVMGSQARLGFHSFRRPLEDGEYTLRDMQGAMAYVQTELLRVTDYMIAVGADIEFMTMQLATPAGSTYWVSSEKALALDVHVIDETAGRLVLPATNAAAGIGTR